MPQVPRTSHWLSDCSSTNDGHESETLMSLSLSLPLLKSREHAGLQRRRSIHRGLSGAVY